MPKIVSTPARSSARIRLCAPVTCSVMSPSSLKLIDHHRRAVPTKKPPGPVGRAEGDARNGWSTGRFRRADSYDENPRESHVHALTLPDGGAGVKLRDGNLMIRTVQRCPAPAPLTGS